MRLPRRGSGSAAPSLADAFDDVVFKRRGHACYPSSPTLLQFSKDAFQDDLRLFRTTLE